MPKEEARAHEEEQEDARVYKVVVNHGEQYSIWFAGRANLSG
jgi:uncharacterized protein YbdZ (MbtH family)